MSLLVLAGKGNRGEFRGTHYRAQSSGHSVFIYKKHSGKRDTKPSKSCCLNTVLALVILDIVSNYVR